MGKNKKGKKQKNQDAEHEFDESTESAELDEEEPKAKRRGGGSSDGSVYKIIEVVGSSPKSWEHAAQVAVARASQTLEDLRVAEVVDQDLKIEDGNISAYRTKLRLSFKFRD